MARVTVEDCIDKVDNRFDLVLLAAHRARMISSGSQLTVDRDNDKNPVVSLREIADSTISPEDLREELVHSLQKFVEVDEPEPDTVPLIGSAGAAYADDHQNVQLVLRQSDVRGAGMDEGLQQWVTLLQEFAAKVQDSANTPTYPTAWHNALVVGDAVRQSLRLGQAVTPVDLM